MKLEFKHYAYIALAIVAVYLVYKYLVKGPEVINTNTKSNTRSSFDTTGQKTSSKSGSESTTTRTSDALTSGRNVTVLTGSHGTTPAASRLSGLTNTHFFKTEEEPVEQPAEETVEETANQNNTSAGQSTPTASRSSNYGIDNPNPNGTQRQSTTGGVAVRR